MTSLHPCYTDRKYKVEEADFMLITKECMESEVEGIRNIANFLRSNSTPILRCFYHGERAVPGRRLSTKISGALSVSTTEPETPTSSSTETSSTSPKSLTATNPLSQSTPFPAHQNAN